MLIVEALVMAILSRWDDGNGASFFNERDQVIRVVSLVSDDEEAIPVGQKRFGLGDIMTLTPSEQKDQGIAQRIDQNVNLGAETAATAA